MTFDIWVGHYPFACIVIYRRKIYCLIRFNVFRRQTRSILVCLVTIRSGVYAFGLTQFDITTVLTQTCHEKMGACWLHHLCVLMCTSFVIVVLCFIPEKYFHGVVGHGPSVRSRRCHTKYTDDLMSGRTACTERQRWIVCSPTAVWHGGASDSPSSRERDGKHRHITTALKSACINARCDSRASTLDEKSMS